MKKYLILPPILMLATMGAFAVDIAAGMVLNTVNASDSGSSSYTEGSYWTSRTVAYDYTIKDSGANFGFFGSVGWKYLDITTAFFWGSATRDVNIDGDVSDAKAADIEKEHEDGKKTSLSALQLGFWFKIPITISRSFRLYPMFGTDMNLGVNYGFGIFPGGGLGADIMLFKNMFLRATALGGWYGGFTNDLYGFGLSFKLGAGWLL